MHDIVAAKRLLRSHLRRALAAMSPPQRAASSSAVCARAAAGPLFPPRSAIMLYAPMVEAGEVDLTPLAADLLARGCRLCIPRVDWTAGTMVPVHVANLDRDLVLEPGSRPACRMPRPDAATIPLAELALVLVPGLGFDRHGRRLGRGGGFYDRFLADLLRGNPGARRVAMAFDEQIVPEVPVEPLDQPVECILTPTETIRPPGAPPV